MTRRIRGIIATDEAIHAYGGFQLSRDVLEQMADQLRRGHIPMTFNHDATRPIAARIVDAGVKILDNGRTAVWADFDVAEDDWEFVQSEFERNGVAGGFSFTTSEAIPGYPEHAAIQIAADAHHFSDANILSALSAFPGIAAAPHRLYQFSFIPEASIIISLALQVLQEVPVDLLSGMISDALRKLGKQDAAITIQKVQDGERSEVIIAVRPRTEREFEAAMAALPEVLRAARSKH